MGTVTKTYTIRIETDAPGDLDQIVRHAMICLLGTMDWDNDHAINVDISDVDGTVVAGHRYDPRDYGYGSGTLTGSGD
jgi:hypothetical protein